LASPDWQNVVRVARLIHIITTRPKKNTKVPTRCHETERKSVVGRERVKVGDHKLCVPAERGKKIIYTSQLIR
jgi:hypothetical protein